ncbi:MAG: site-2 protease family protein [archaeon]
MSLRIARFSGIDIEVHYSWMVVFFLIAVSLATGAMPHRYPGLSQAGYWTVGFLASALLFASVLLHEMSHSLVGKKSGLAISKITLFFFGGISEIAEEPKSPGIEFGMAAAGPAMSFLLASLFTVIKTVTNLIPKFLEITAIVEYGAQINLLLGVFNLLPAYPMDGGRILKAAIWRLKNDVVVATKVASSIGMGFSYLMIVGGFVGVLFGLWEGLWYVLIGFFLRSGAQSSLTQTLIGKALVGTTVSSLMTREVVTVNPELTLSEFVEIVLRHKHGGYPVLEKGTLVGLMTMEDLRRVNREKWSETRVGDVMTPVERLVMVRPDHDASEALVKMARYDIGRLLVMQEGVLLGIVTRSDIMHTIQTKTQLGL